MHVIVMKRNRYVASRGARLRACGRGKVKACLGMKLVAEAGSRQIMRRVCGREAPAGRQNSAPPGDANEPQAVGVPYNAK